MKRSFSIMTVIAAITIFLFLAGCARTPEQRAERMVEHVSQELQLNDAQKAHLEKIKDEFLARRVDVFKARNEGFDEAIALLKSDQIDPAKLNALTEKTQAHVAEAVKFFFAKFAEFHDMLTPEQRAKAAEKLSEHRQEHMHR